MPTLQIDHRVRDFEGWKRAFDSDPVGREAGGVRSYRISQVAGDPLHVLIELDFETAAEAEAFGAKLRSLWEGGASERLGLESPTARVVHHVERGDY